MAQKGHMLWPPGSGSIPQQLWDPMQLTYFLCSSIIQIRMSQVSGRQRDSSPPAVKCRRLPRWQWPELKFPISLFLQSCHAFFSVSHPKPTFTEGLGKCQRCCSHKHWPILISIRSWLWAHRLSHMLQEFPRYAWPSGCALAFLFKAVLHRA